MSEEKKEKLLITDMLGEVRSISDVFDYNDTIGKEISEWEKLQPRTIEIQSIITRLQTCIIPPTKSGVNDDSWFRRELGAKKKMLEQAMFANSPVFAEISSLLSLGSDNLTGFYNYLYLRKVSVHIPSINQIVPFNLEGPVRAIQFLSKNIKLIEDEDTARSSLEHIRNDYLQSKEELDDKIKEIVNNFTTSKTLLETEWKSQFLAIQEEEKNKISEFLNKEAELVASFQNSQRELEKIYKRNLNAEMGDLKRLEELYGEKLKIEEPAKFWKEKERLHQKNSFISLGILLLLVCGSLAFFGWAFILDSRRHLTMPAG